MTPTKQAYKGCRDFFPADMRTRDYLFSNMRKVAESFAYEPYDGPLLEEVALYKAKSGEELINEQIYSFTDRGQRKVAIRPEMTPTLARMVAKIHKQTSKPLRWYSIPNLMRYEKPQRGRVREHWQFNVDIFGAPSNLAEIEILTLITEFLKSFGADKSMFSILLNDRRVVDAVFKEVLSLNEDSSHRLYKVLDKSKKVSSEKLDFMISEIIQEPTKKSIFKEYLALTSLTQVLSFIEKFNLTHECDEFQKFITISSQLPINEFIQYDPTIVRGLDYYTGIVFEIFDQHPENNRAIAGGGSYAHMLKIFNESPPLAGVGFGLGDVTLKDFLDTHKLLKNFATPKNDLFVIYTDSKNEIDSIQFSNNLRQSGLKVETHLGSLKFNKIIKLAETKGYKYVGIIETKDSKSQIQIKDLTLHKNFSFNLDDIEKIQHLLTPDLRADSTQ